VVASRCGSIGLYALAGLLVACHPPDETPARSLRRSDASVAPSEPLEAPPDERWFGTHDAREPLPLVIALHGLGDTPESFVELFDGLPTRARVVALRGLTPWSSSGWSWFSPGLDPNSPASARSVEAAADVVVERIHQTASRRATCGVLVVVGFSQGAMLADTLAATHPELHALFVPIAGRLAPETPIASGPHDGDSVHALHGTSDARVALDDAVRSDERFRSAGIMSTLDRYPGVGHTITPSMRQDLFRIVVDATSRGCAHSAATAR
jgi:phospholipase/carboxylesterase